MFEEIKKKYGDFHDALISGINYKLCNEKLYPDDRDLEVILSCENSTKNFEHETIKLTFECVSTFKFSEIYSGTSLLVYAALLKKDEEVITFDFFADIYGDWLLKENPNSNFIVKCKKVSYEVLSGN